MPAGQDRLESPDRKESVHPAPLTVLWWLSTAVLLVSGSLKIVEGVHYRLGPPVPPFLIDYLHPAVFAVAAGGLEIIVAAVLVLGRSVGIKALSVGLLVIAFGSYRAMLAATAGTKMGCGCLGGGLFIPKEIEGTVSNILLLILLTTALLSWRHWRFLQTGASRNDPSDSVPESSKEAPDGIRDDPGASDSLSRNPPG